jgi:hypothetical protein
LCCREAAVVTKLPRFNNKYFPAIWWCSKVSEDWINALLNLTSDVKGAQDPTTPRGKDKETRRGAEAGLRLEWRSWLDIAARILACGVCV